MKRYTCHGKTAKDQMKSFGTALMNIPPYIKKANAKTALAIAVLLIIWISFGMLFSNEVENDPALLDAPPQSVRFASLKAEPHVKTITLTGVTDEARRIDVRAEVTGKILKIPAKEGSFVKKGDVILQIEPRDLKARLKEAEALVKQRRIEYDTATNLARRGLEAKNRQAEAAAQLEEVEALRILAQINLDNATIRAPFDGVLERVNVEVGTLVGPNIRQREGTDSDGSTIATFIDVNPIKVFAELSERYIRQVSQDQQVHVELLDGERYTGKLSYIAHMARPQTRTFQLEADIPNPDQEIRSGVTATLIVPLVETTGHAIPTSALALNKEDITGVKFLENLREEDGVIYGEVRFTPVDIFDFSGNKLVIRGLPDVLNLITVGHSFVTEGDTVRAVREAVRGD